MAELHLRVPASAAHYGGDLVAGSYVLGLFGDVLTYAAVVADSDEGLLRSYSEVEFLAPVHPGDFLRITAVLTERSRLRRWYDLAATRTAKSQESAERPSAARAVEPEATVATAKAQIVIPVQAARGGAQ